MPKTQELFYAVVGAGDFAVQKAKNVRKLADRKVSQKYYKDFVKRGRTLATKVKNTAPAKRALEGTEVARRRFKSATANVTKAVRRDGGTSKSRSTKTTAAKGS